MFTCRWYRAKSHHRQTNAVSAVFCTLANRMTGVSLWNCSRKKPAAAMAGLSGQWAAARFPPCSMLAPVAAKNCSAWGMRSSSCGACGWHRNAPAARQPAPR